MRALIVCASPEPLDAHRLRALACDHDLLIAADGGCAAMSAAGIVPHLVVGDLDSVGSLDRAWLEKHGVALEAHSPRKDVTDLDLALDAARRRGADAVTVAGALGGRLDHELAALGSLMRASDLRPHLVAPRCDAWLLANGGRRGVEIGWAGALVSVIALSPTATARSTGLEWALDGIELEALSSRGVSNVAVRESASVSVVRGTILVIVQQNE